MHRSFGGSVFDPVEEQRDREITVGPVLLAVCGLALLALCSVCFIAGYATGRNSQPVIAAPSPNGPSAAELLRSQPKPDATQSSAGASAAVAGPAAATTPGTADAGTGSAAATAPAGSASATTAPAIVHAALPAQATAGQPASGAAPVQSALPPAGSWMVQIAAVSHQEDADVLMTALRQRGYAVAQRRDPTDDLIHVQVGPLSTYNAAVAMRQRLLNDGYNAVVQP